MHYLPLTPQDETTILKRLGLNSFEELLNQIIPPEIQYRGKIGLPDADSEVEVRKVVRSLAKQNLHTDDYISFLGAGIYDHYIPAIIDQIILRSEYYTAYTPYQAEVSQGTLQTIFEYQSAICELTKMDIANASMYDAGSALAEACHMAHTIKKRKKVILSELIHPFYLKIVHTYLKECDIEIVICPADEGLTNIDKLSKLIDENTDCVCVQHPNFYGNLESVNALEEITHNAGALFIPVVDPISLGVISPPGEYNADIVVGEGQAMGISQGFGGPLLGFLASKKEFVRYLPGRIVGETVDVEGKRGFVLTLQTREQHIRREKATSNICTNEALCALSSLIYLSTLGRQGIKEVACQCFSKSHYLYKHIKNLQGIRPAFSQEFFKEFLVKTEKPADDIIRALIDKKIFAGVALSHFNPEQKNYMLIAVTEKRTRQELDHYIETLSQII
ncbi:glycine dehydrogenase (aminomethyl-transferring) [candidate division WOR-3 bacterium 4484_100]|uniref:Probable glycine dehydrogenase (decarboxylating) subunit 1 n=1 Tax=candidate division WOR-3 bacterium 4484_100 TaxID=1936077 RepID=A0A1V4QF66_UNCW3|nr:MAG: glycine dehydrogenase (aminomethyl-transferring) [candidate division WOR-3 bacterium 4484_100]